MMEFSNVCLHFCTLFYSGFLALGSTGLSSELSVSLNLDPLGPYSEVENVNVTVTCKVESGNLSKIIHYQFEVDDGHSNRTKPESLHLCDDNIFPCYTERNAFLLKNVKRTDNGDYYCKALTKDGIWSSSPKTELLVYREWTMESPYSEIPFKASHTTTAHETPYPYPTSTAYEIVKDKWFLVSLAAILCANIFGCFAVFHFRKRRTSGQELSYLGVPDVYPNDQSSIIGTEIKSSGGEDTATILLNTGQIKECSPCIDTSSCASASICYSLRKELGRPGNLTPYPTKALFIANNNRSEECLDGLIFGLTSSSETKLQGLNVCSCKHYQSCREVNGQLSKEGSRQWGSLSSQRKYALKFGSSGPGSYPARNSSESLPPPPTHLLSHRDSLRRCLQEISYPSPQIPRMCACDLANTPTLLSQSGASSIGYAPSCSGQNPTLPYELPSSVPCSLGTYSNFINSPSSDRYKYHEASRAPEHVLTSLV